MLTATKSATDGGAATARVTYAYDALGNRIQREAWDGSTTVTGRYGLDGWDPAKPPPIGNEGFDAYIDLDGSNNVTMRRAWGVEFDEAVARQTAAGAVAWYQADRQGSVRQVIDNSAGVLSNATFSAYGELTGGSLSDRIGYTGQEYDALTGNISMGGGLRETFNGRFLQEDVKFPESGVNPWVYGNNSPTNYTDPSGMDIITYSNLTEEQRTQIAQFERHRNRLDREADEAAAREAAVRVERARARTPTDPRILEAGGPVTGYVGNFGGGVPTAFIGIDGKEYDIPSGGKFYTGPGGRQYWSSNGRPTLPSGPLLPKPPSNNSGTDFGNAPGYGSWGGDAGRLARDRYSSPPPQTYTYQPGYGPYGGGPGQGLPAPITVPVPKPDPNARVETPWLLAFIEGVFIRSVELVADLYQVVHQAVTNPRELYEALEALGDPEVQNELIRQGEAELVEIFEKGKGRPAGKLAVDGVVCVLPVLQQLDKLRKVQAAVNAVQAARATRVAEAARIAELAREAERASKLPPAAPKPPTSGGGIGGGFVRPGQIPATGPWSLNGLGKACFAAGTPLRTPGGSKPIEQFVPGDLVLSRHELDPEGEVVPKVVEEVFLRVGRILSVRVGRQTIRTTAEHPFWIQGKGWLPARELIAGDRLVSHDGQSIVVSEVVDTAEWQAVYNLRIADFHTYFVGCDEWGFSVWAHNTCAYYANVNGEWVLFSINGQVLGRSPSTVKGLQKLLADNNLKVADVTRVNPVRLTEAEIGSQIVGVEEINARIGVIRDILRDGGSANMSPAQAQQALEALLRWKNAYSQTLGLPARPIAAFGP